MVEVKDKYDESAHLLPAPHLHMVHHSLSKVSKQAIQWHLHGGGLKVDGQGLKVIDTGGCTSVV
jgi:hypothetical protein